MKSVLAKRLKVGDRVCWKNDPADIGVVTANGVNIIEIKWTKLDSQEQVQRLHHVDCKNVHFLRTGDSK